jgi:Tc5 transposase DNA-binding domain
MKTLYRHSQGGRTHCKVNTHQQALSPDEECALVKWIKYLSYTGHPVRHKSLCALAKEIRRPRVELKNSPFSHLGNHWVEHFLLRNPSLKSKVAKSIEAVHKEVTEEQLQNWFSTFKCITEEHDILPENIYNMDEIGSPHHSSILIEGFNIGVQEQNAWVIYSAMEKQTYEAEPGRTEWVTVVKCIC